MKTCDLIKCPLNRVVTVHEIGYAEKNFYDSGAIEIYETPPYFVPQYPRVRNFAVHAFKEIDGFCLPTMKFEKVRRPGWKSFVLSDIFKWTKTGEVSGGWIRLDNGQTIYVQETLEELKNLIEGNAKEDAK